MYFLTYRVLCVIVVIVLHSRITAVKVIGRSVTVPVGHSATLFCQLTETNEDLTRITWQKRTREKTKNATFFVIIPDGTIEHVNGLNDRAEFIGNIQEHIGSISLKNITLQDEGIYTCIFNIFPSGPFETEIKITVLVPPVIDTPEIIPVAGDDGVTLATCTAAKALPAAEVSWILGALSTSVRVETSQFLHTDGTYNVTSHLIGVASKELNQQKVQCLVNHTALNTTLVVDCTIVIHYPPQVVNFVSVGEATKTQQFLCEADGNPKPTHFTWKRVNKTLSSQTGDRLLVPLTPDHSGLYICEAANQYGSVTGSIYVPVAKEHSTYPWKVTAILCIIIIFSLIMSMVFRKTLRSHLLQVYDRICHLNCEHHQVPSQSPSEHLRREEQELSAPQGQDCSH